MQEGRTQLEIDGAKTPARTHRLPTKSRRYDGHEIEPCLSFLHKIREISPCAPHLPASTNPGLAISSSTILER